MSTYVSEVRAASIIRVMMEAAHTCETSFDIKLRTQQYIQKILSFILAAVRT
jgi:hypothetical protein